MSLTRAMDPLWALIYSSNAQSLRRLNLDLCSLTYLAYSVKRRPWKNRRDIDKLMKTLAIRFFCQEFCSHTEIYKFCTGFLFWYPVYGPILFQPPAYLTLGECCKHLCISKMFNMVASMHISKQNFVIASLLKKRRLTSLRAFGSCTLYRVAPHGG